jgi:actin-related protein 6
MESERFSVPEVLFSPSDIGIEQAGIAEISAQSILSLWPIEQQLCGANVVLTGGNTHIPGFKARFDTDVRTLLPNGIQFKVCTILEWFFVYIPLTWTCA